MEVLKRRLPAGCSKKGKLSFFVQIPTKTDFIMIWSYAAIGEQRVLCNDAK